jgi:putative ABC transport system permease protein
MREEVQPLTVRIVPWRHTFLTLGISSQNLPSTIHALEKKWQQLAPGLPFNYFFANDAFDAQYKAEERFGKLFICFAISTMIISCLGLLALSYFTIVQRTKELGIRKVLGASVGGIAALLSKDFLKPVFISFVAAVPVSWLAMHIWLQSYAYRVTISWWMFLLAGVIVLCISTATICTHTIKAARANPIKNLKVE